MPTACSGVQPRRSLFATTSGLRLNAAAASAIAENARTPLAVLIETGDRLDMKILIEDVIEDALAIVRLYPTVSATTTADREPVPPWGRRVTEKDRKAVRRAVRGPATPTVPRQVPIVSPRELVAGR